MEEYKEPCIYICYVTKLPFYGCVYMYKVINYSVLVKNLLIGDQSLHHAVV